MEESFRLKGLRKKLVEGLRKKGITDERVLEAIGKIPRHAFIDSGFSNFAYEDRPFSIGAGQTISQPYTVAVQTELLQLDKWDKVLEIGTGSGYQAAVLAEIGVQVYTIERQRELYIKAQQTLRKLGYRPHFFFGDGYEGKPAFAPFNKILVTAGAAHVPEKLLQQLAIGGRIVVPVGDTGKQAMTVIDRVSETKFRTTQHGDFIFVPMLGGIVKD
ncbi:MAG: protein-L-isoaspartate(D-aspartate) O-methyltransferase [Prevotellaceae bacterium]|jgi:protein-L-isoaspartate(D-aspartate) O-methyltransferase|nr:protein-L-isoaspartate(D-aspartate) O-methyltransferase [Prevotellaceae bacterium]